MTMASSSSSLAKSNAAAAAQAAKENTVFVRFVPPSANIRRHHLEDLFSQIGPIRKSSVIVPRAPKPPKGAPPPSPYGNDEETKPSSYGFIKYTTPQDASAAAAKLHHATIRLSDQETIQIRVERASDAANGAGKSPDNKGKKNHPKSPSSEPTGKNNKKQQPNKSLEKEQHPSPQSEANHRDATTTPNLKDHRLILRNLSFYAKESHVRQVLEAQFGKIVEVHIPHVPKTSETKGATHRGFGFVTFEKPESAEACLQAKDSIVIKKRSVTVERSLNKTMYENKKQQQKQKEDSTNNLDSKNPDKKKDTKKAVAMKEDEDEAGDNSSKDDASIMSGDDDDASQHSGSDDDKSIDGDKDAEKMKDDNSENDEKEERSNNRDENAVSEKRALFVRNLPFDATRHDLFELFHKFGYITGIFLVKDKETGIAKGTAFISYRDHASVTKALDQARHDNKFVPQREASEKQTGSTDAGAELSIKGRRVFVSLALDKDTASTLVMEKATDRHSSGKDRRNLYLKGEGRVDNENEQDTTWDDIPEQDKNKRQKAWSDKNTKLRSPIFFINPTRLSIRNLSKTVDEQQLKQLCVEATKRGLAQKLVTVEDAIAHWRASGDMNSRDIMDRVEAEGDAIIAPFDEKNVKKHIPSVFIDRDFTGAKKEKSSAPSRGFGWVEFESHVHALACLREMNNNPRYSPEYAAGGHHATELRKKSHKRKKPAEASDFIGSDGQVKVPRLVVEFTVENRAKARLQAEHRAQQQANKVKQKIENKEKSASEKKKEKKKSRGAKQRERKRKGEDDEEELPMKESRTTEVSPKAERKKKEEKTKGPQAPAPKPVKPAKKQKVDKEESRFDKLVASYEVGFAAEPDLADAPKRAKKRWYEG